MKRDARQILTELLVLRVQGREGQAFTSLHDLWRGDVERMAMVSTGHVDAAKEVAQETWIAVARGIRSFAGPGLFSALAVPNRAAPSRGLCSPAPTGTRPRDRSRSGSDGNGRTITGRV